MVAQDSAPFSGVQSRPRAHPLDGTKSDYTVPGGPARANALLAVEHDPIRRRERLLDLRLAAAVLLAKRLDVAECLLMGLRVPATRLDSRLVEALGLQGDVLLDMQLTYRLLAQGPERPGAEDEGLS